MVIAKIRLTSDIRSGASAYNKFVGSEIVPIFVRDLSLGCEYSKTKKQKSAHTL